MKVHDLTQKICENMPVYPGTEKPKLTPMNTIEKDGFKETLLSMFSHTGTHMDAPAHIFPDAPSLDRLPASQFCGTCAVIDCRDAGEGGTITLDHVKRAGDAVNAAEFLLFNTGWSAHWQEEKYFGAYPRFDEEVIRFAAQAGRKGIGIDAISIDPIDSADLPMHRIILGARMVIIENLVGLNELIGKRAVLYALPLRYENADGSPIRAIAVE